MVIDVILLEKYIRLKKVVSTIRTSAKITKLNKGTYYKYTAVAYKTTTEGQKVIASSKTIHVTTIGGKVGNYKKVKLNKKIVKLKCGKVFKIKAEQVPEKKKLKVMVKIFGRKTPLELGFMQVEKE